MSSTFPPPAIRDLAVEVSSLLKDRSETVCVAETVRLTDHGNFDAFLS